MGTLLIILGIVVFAGFGVGGYVVMNCIASMLQTASNAATLLSLMGANVGSSISLQFSTNAIIIGTAAFAFVGFLIGICMVSNGIMYKRIARLKRKHVKMG